MHRFFYTGFGVGLLPGAPGTWGSLVVAGLFLGLGLLGVPAGVLMGVMGVVIVLSAVATVVCGRVAIAELGEDPSVVVSDEFCGQALTYFWVWQVADRGEFVALVVAGFVLFRVFDILKPPPVRQLDRLTGSWGVLLDDVMAGVYAQIVLQIVFRLGWLGGF